MSAGSANQLKKSALGTPGIVFLVVSSAAPLGATLGTAPVAFAASGTGVPGMYLIATAILLLFAVGYATMARYVTNAGGFTAYVSLGLGRRAGEAAAGIGLLAYNCMLAGVSGQFGEFAHDLLARWDLRLPWQALVLVALAMVGVLGYLEVDLSSKVLGVVMIAEVLILLVFDIAVIGSGGAQGIDLDAVDPAAVFAKAPGVALLLAFTCYIGFEAATVYGEEARNPRRTVPRATYVAVLLMGAFYAVTIWAIGLAHGSGAVAADAAADPVGFVTAVNAAFVGRPATELMQVLVVTSLFAVLLAVHNTLTRYLFSLGRGGLLSASLGRTHHRFRSPHKASLAQSAFTLLALSAFMIAGVQPFAQLYPWLVGLGTLAVLLLQATTSAAVIVFFRRREHGSRWQTLAAPLLGGLGLLLIIALAVANFDILTGLTGPAAVLLPWLIPLAGILALLASAWHARRGRPVTLTTSRPAEPPSSDRGLSATPVLDTAPDDGRRP
ncbi:APC family permease [Amycolatopsis halotolerans]|uniref:APC family permease n=1 Tax=Amycolatopsis halotolerans TaxID=330083 RepID=A0ABV7QWT8_9PSEU